MRFTVADPSRGQLLVDFFFFFCGLFVFEVRQLRYTIVGCASSIVDCPVAGFSCWFLRVFFTHTSPPHALRLPKARKTLESREICLHMRAVKLAGGSQTRELATSGLSIPGGHPGGWVRTLLTPP